MTLEEEIKVLDERYAGLFEDYKKLMERMKNCSNCDHKEVCHIVAIRKQTQANNYSPCDHWKLGGE